MTKKASLPARQRRQMAIKVRNDKAGGSFEEARIAAALGKSRAARFLDAELIASDAIQTARHGKRILKKPAGARSDDTDVSELRKIAHRYGAELVNDRFEGERVIGLLFLDGSYTDMVRHVFRLL